MSLNFDRLNLLRPDYGYRNHKNITLKDLDDSTDGIFYVDLKNNKTSLLISIDQLKKIKPEADFKHAQHKVNHIMINPAGTHFMFMHRWIINGRRHDRLMVSDMQARNVQLVASGIVSHCCWLNNDDIFGFFTSDEKLPGFHIIRNAVNTFNIEKPDMFSGLGDGHPSALNNKILFDTYPDKARQKSLLVYNPDNGKKEKLGEFYESMKFYNETRCDLHPRWDFKGEYVFFDSVHKGKRKLYSLKYE